MTHNLANARFTKPAADEGYIYVAQDEDTPMQSARVGEEVRIADRGSRWLAVFKQPEKVLVARWPGRLWYVKIVDAVTAEEQHATGNVPAKSAGYTRCVAVKILEEVSTSRLFDGNGNGHAVVQVIEKARTLTTDEAELLAENRCSQSAEVLSKAWSTWLRAKDQWESESKNIRENAKISKINSVAGGSPIGCGLSVVSKCVFDRAVEIAGEAATMSDGEEIWLQEPWSGAGSVLHDTAFAVGAAQLLSRDESEKLLEGWMRVFGVDEGELGRKSA